MKFISALFLAATTFFQGLFGVKTPPPLPVVNAIKIYLVPTATDLEIHLSGSNQDLSAIAVRLVYHYSNTPSGITITPNALLFKDNWSFPVKKADINATQKTVTFDLAAVNISTTGYLLNSDFSLAKINLSAGLDQFSFDPKETKIYGKDTKEIPLIFN